MSRETAAALLSGTPLPEVVPATSTTPAGSPGLQPVPNEPAKVDGDILQSTRFAQLSKKESELVRQREAFKTEQAAFIAERDRQNSIGKKWQDLEDLKSKDPVAAMKAAGFTDTDLVNFFAAQEDTRTPAEQAQQATQAELKKWEDARAAEAKEAQSKSYAQTLTQFKQNISATIAADPVKYEFCAYNGPIAEDLIYETVAAVLESDKVIISTKEAAEMVETYYEEQYNSLKALKKVQPKQEVVEEKVEPQRTRTLQAKPEEARPASKSITSRHTATVASTIQRKETASEKRERLIRTLGSLDKK